MRPGIVLAACLVPLAFVAGIVVACGGPAFTSASPDGGPPVTTEAGSVDGASTDAGVSFCAVEAGTHTFCDDFDGLPLASKWSSITQTNGGTAAADSTKSYSPPNSLKTLAPGNVGAAYGRVVKAFTQTASTVVVAFEVWIDSAPPKDVVTTAAGDNFVEIDLGSSYSIGLSAHDEVTYFENVPVDGGTAQQNLSSGQLVPTSTLESGWTEIVIEVDVANAALSVSIGGQPQLTGQKITPPPGQLVSVAMGAYLHNEATAELAAHYDDVTIDLTP